MRAAAIVLTMLTATTNVAFAECSWTSASGQTNRPGIEGNPAARIDPNGPRMECNITTSRYIRNADNTPGKVISFSIRK